MLIRKKAVAKSLGITFTKLNEIVRGRINYYRISYMKLFIEKFGSWLRHKVRVVILKQWKRPKKIYTNLKKLRNILHSSIEDDKILGIENARKGLYKMSTHIIINYLISPKILAMKKGDRPGLVNHLQYYLSKM